MKLQTKKSSLAAVFLTLFVDNLSWAIVFPIFAPYFLDLFNHLFSPDVPMATRTLLLGGCLAVFSLGQFLGAPLIGEYADRHGRKKAFLATIFFTCAGLVFTAVSMHERWLGLLFAMRFMTGFFAGNMAICLACVADLSKTPEDKAKNFGYFAMTAGLSFILGAFVGGKLSDPTLYASLRPDVPIWLAAALTAMNFLFVLFGFKETSKIDSAVRFSLVEGFRNIILALRTEKLKGVYLIFFLFSFSWTILFQFTPVLFVEAFQFTSSDLGNLALYMGLCWMIGSGYLNKLFLKIFHQLKTLEVCLLAFTFLTILLIFSRHIYSAVAIVGSCVMVGGIAWPLWTSLTSNLAPREIQGKILGMTQSTQSLAMALAPAIGGVSYRGSIEIVFLVGAAACLLAGILYFSLKE